MSPEAYWIASPSAGAILQSELLSNILEYRPKVETITGTEADVEFEEVTHPLAVVVTQDCDLDLDHQARQSGVAGRLIENVLLCEADDATAMRERGGIKSSEQWRRVESHQTERYQVLQPVPVAIADGGQLPALTGGGDRGTHQVALVEPAAPRRRWFEWLLPHAAPPTPVRIEPVGRIALPAQFRGKIGLDFRRVFTVPMPELLRRIEIGEARRHCYLSPVYRDHLSNRFYWYHMRVALEEERG